MICHDQWAISIHEFGFNLELIPNTQIYSLLGSYGFHLVSIFCKTSTPTQLGGLILPTPGPSNRHFFFKVEWGGLLTKRSWSGQPCHPTLDAWTWTQKMEAKWRGVFSFHSFWWWRQVEFFLTKGYKGWYLFHFMHMFWGNWNLYLYFPWSDLGAF